MTNSATQPEIKNAYILIGQRIKEKRILNKYTRAELEKLSNVNNRTIMRIEKGLGGYLGSYIQLANALNIKLSVLLKNI